MNSPGKKYSTILFFLTIAVYCQAGNGMPRDNYPSGARASGLSNAGVTFSDLWSNFHNQAGLGFYKKLSFGYHFENKHVISDFAMQSLALAVPTNTGTIGGSITFYGNAHYNESKVSLAFGKPFGEKFAAGIQLNLLSIFQQEDYGNSSALAVEGGILYKISENITWGFHASNPTGSRYRRLENEQVPILIETGFGFQVSEKLLLVTEAEKIISYSYVFKAGAEYQIVESIYARAAFSTFKYSTYSFGVGFSQKRIKADVAFSHHIILGYTPHFSLNYIFN
jgi:hypothetical protein